MKTLPLLLINNSYPIYEVPNRFSWQHITFLMIDVIFIITFLFILKNKGRKTQSIALYVLSIINVILFSGRIFFGWENARIYNSGEKTTLLPLELCNLNIYITLLTLLLNSKTKENPIKRVLNNYMYFVCLIASSIPLIVFPDCHMITSGRNIFHYMFFDYWIIHTNLLLTSIALVYFKWFTPSIKDVKWVLLLLVFIFSSIFLITLGLRKTPYFKNANYMYIFNDNNLPILRTLHKLIKLPFIYELPLIVPISIVFYLMALPFSFNKKEIKKC